MSTHQCPACGTWGPPRQRCTRCTWPSTEPRSAGRPAVRVCLGVQHDDHGHRLQSLDCARLPWLSDQRGLRTGIEERLDGRVDWSALLEHTEDAVRQLLGALDIPALNAEHVHVQCRVLLRSLREHDGPVPEGVHRVAPSASLRANGEGVALEALQWSLGVVDLRPGSPRPQSLVTAPLEIRVDRVQLLDGDRTVAEAAPATLVRADTPTPVPWPDLTLEDRKAMAQRTRPWTLRYLLHGRSTPWSVDVPDSVGQELPPADRHGRIALHGGSHTLRQLLRLGPEAHWEAFEAATWQDTNQGWGAERGEWRATAQGLEAWLAAALPALAARCAQDHDAWLDGVTLAVPGDEGRAGALGGPVLKEAMDRHTLGEGLVTRTEGEAVVTLVRPLLLELRKRVRQHRAREGDRIKREKTAVQAWQAAKQRSENPLLKHVVAAPGRRPPDPSPRQAMPGMPAALEAALARHDLGRVQVLDIGATGVDVYAWRYRMKDAALRVDDPSPELVWQALESLDTPTVVIATGGGSAWIQELRPWVSGSKAVIVTTKGLAEVAVAIGLDPDEDPQRHLLQVHARAGAVPGRFDVLGGLP